MFSPHRKLKIIAFLVCILFAAGLIRLFLLRFEAGNVYPVYSSLRSDPLGTRALFDSLDRVSGTNANRNFRPWPQVALDQQTTLFIVGLKHAGANIETDSIEKLLEKLAQSGGRLVFTFYARSKYWNETSEKLSDADEHQDASESGETNTETSEEFVEENIDGECDSNVSGLNERSGLDKLGLRIKSKKENPSEAVALRNVDKPDILPLEISWRSPLYFEPSEGDWKTLYIWQQEPVVVQRQWGKGSLVMVADSYVLSNEALRNHRVPGFLAWLAVPGHDLIFDEFHKGLSKQPGIAGLTRQYRLHWVITALLVVAGLFIWRQTAIFVPSVQSEGAEVYTQPAVGRDTSQGMVDLSRKHIGAGALLTVCFKTWKSQAAKHVPQSRVDEVELLVAQAAADSHKEVQVKTYKQICELLKQGKRS